MNEGVGRKKNPLMRENARPVVNLERLLVCKREEKRTRAMPETILTDSKHKCGKESYAPSSRSVAEIERMDAHDGAATDLQSSCPINAE